LTTIENNRSDKAKFIDQTLVLKSCSGYALVAQVTLIVSAAEQRIRKRKPQDQLNFDQQVMAIVANLALQVVGGDEQPVFVQRSHRVLGSVSRYKPSFMTKSFTDTLDLFITAGLIDQELGTRLENPFDGPDYVVATAIQPTAKLVEMIDSSSIDAADFGRGQGGETIILKAPKEGHWDGGKYQEYMDTEVTLTYREQMRTINEFLAEADIGFIDEFGLAGPVNVHDRQLRRIFTRVSFNQGGRLFDGFWLDLKEDQRLLGLRINGKPVVSLDYGQMIVRLAYGRVGQPRTAEDAYLIEPYGERYWEGFKKLIASMLFSTKALSRKPQGTKQMLPKDDVSLLCRTVTNYHNHIAPLLNIGLGYELIFMESEVIVSVMISLIDNGVAALLAHDDIVFASNDDANVALGVMRHDFINKVGIHATIKMEES